MPPVRKFTLGIRPARRLFSVQSRWGEIADAVFQHIRRSKTFEADYFSALKTSDSRDTFAITMTNDITGNALTISMDNFIFVRDATTQGDSIQARGAMAQFRELWEVIDGVVTVSTAKRIGLVGETHIETGKSPTAELLERITLLGGENHPAKFNLRYERRFNTPEGIAPDVRKHDFENVATLQRSAKGSRPSS